MTKPVTVVVVGNGIVGASVAFHLAEAGAGVLVVDDGRVGRATFAGAGILSAPGWAAGAAVADLQLKLGAFAGYPALVNRLGLGDSGTTVFGVIGELHVAPLGAVLDQLAERLGQLEKSGAYPPGTVRRLNEAETRAMFPYLRRDLASVHVASTCRVDGEALRLALFRGARRRGASFVPGPATLDLTAGALVGVSVAGRSIGADAIVVAAGAWAAEVLRPLGVSLGVTPQRGQILHLSLPGDDTSRLPAVLPAGADHYLLPFPAGRIVVGATRESGPGFDPRLTGGGVAHVLNNALGVAPGLADATLVELRVGLRPTSADGLPVLGPVPGQAGLWVATGMGATGLSVGPYCGELIADAVLGRAPAVDLSPFAVGRSLL